MKLGQPFLGNMRKSAIFRCSVIMVFIMKDVAGSLTVLPKNNAALNGEEVTMVCKTNGISRLRLEGQRPGSATNDVIYSGYGFSSYAASFCELISNVDGEFSVRINTSIESAMRYTFLEPGSLESWSAELIIIESPPSCTTTFGHDYVNITCIIGFRGHWKPVMEWSRCGGSDETVITDDIYDFNPPYERLRSTLIITRNGRNNGTCYQVTTKFRGNERPQETNATNIPDYNHTIIFNRSVDILSSTEYGILKITAIITGIFLAAALLISIGIVYWCKKLRRRRNVLDSDVHKTLTNNGKAPRRKRRKHESPRNQ